MILSRVGVGPACVRLGSVYYPGVNSSQASSISDYHHAASRACPVTSLGLDGPVRGLSVGWPGTKIREMRCEGADCWVGAGRPGYIDWKAGYNTPGASRHRDILHCYTTHCNKFYSYSMNHIYTLKSYIKAFLKNEINIIVYTQSNVQ